jgi:hypothetical protein
MMKITIEIPAEYAERIARDILIIAVEGGSNYWLAYHSIKRYTEEGINYLDVLEIRKPFDKETGEWFDASCFSEGFKATPHHITPETVKRGIKRLFSPGVLPKRGDIRNAVLQAVSDPSDLDVYADGADVILQLGLFGNLVFG